MSGRRRAAAPAGGARSPNEVLLRVLADGRLSAGAVAGGLLVLALIVQLAGGGAATVRATSDDVRAAVLACPAAPALGAAADRLTVAAAPAEPKTTKGAMRVDELPADTDPKLRRTSPGIARVDLSGTKSPAAVVRATGGLAPGLVAERASAITEGPARSLSTVTCTPAGASAWFVGASTLSKHQSRLVLTNPEGTPASVGLEFWDSDGAVEVPNTDEIEVPARSVRIISLDGLVPDRKRIGLGVEVSTGQVAAALHMAEISGRGADWLDPLVSPARRLVLPAIAAEADDRKLFLMAPGDRDAIVKVRMLGQDNEFAPAGADVVELRAGQVKELNLNAADPGRALTAVINADVPVVAAIRTVATVGSAPEQAWTGPAAELTGPTTIADGRGGSAGRTRLLLAAPAGDVTLTLTLHVGKAEPKTRTVKVAAGRTLVLDPGGKGVNRYTVTLAPTSGSGPVHIARMLRIDDAGWTVTALDSARLTVQLPAVVPDLSAATAQRPDG